MRVLVCGGGVIGASIAHFLGRRGVEVIVVERTAVACAASGKSGGFLALDWCDGSPLQELARRSFALHAELADALGPDTGYRRLETFSGFGSARPGAGRSHHDHDWLSERVRIQRRLGTPETTAQIHPAGFTEAMLRSAKGATLRIGEVTGLVRGSAASGARVTGVEVDGETLEGDAVVIAMGPWSILAARWLPLPAVYGLKGHSIVFDTDTPEEALFLEFEEADGAVASPEVFPRPDGTTYVCAISSESPLPLDPASVVPDPGAIERLEAICRVMSPDLGRAKILARQACFRPVTQDGLPMIGAIQGLDGAYVATGHSVWGMLNAPATGEAMAQLIVDGAARLDLSAFDPGRMRPLDPAELSVG